MRLPFAPHLVPRLIWALCAALVAAPLAAAELAGHRALYTLTLETARGDIIGASGTMGFEVIDACDAWAVRQRLAITVTSRDGTDIDLTSDYTTWESKDGLKLRFRMRQSTEDAIVTDLAGTATLERTGGPGRATYTQPVDTTKDLPAGTMFPTAHTEALFAADRANTRFFAVPLFDGTSADGVQDSTTAIAAWTQPTPTPPGPTSPPCPASASASPSLHAKAPSNNRNTKSACATGKTASPTNSPWTSATTSSPANSPNSSCPSRGAEGKQGQGSALDPLGPEAPDPLQPKALKS